MLTLAFRRLAALIPTMLLLSFAVFGLSLSLHPERAAVARSGGSETTLETLKAAEEELRLDEPLIPRYLHWLGGAVHGDFGRSFVRLETVQTENGTELRGESVVAAIGQFLPRTLSLVAVAVLFVILIGVPIGVLGGVRQGSFSDRVAMLFGTIGLSMPSFFVAMLLVSWLAIEWHVLPAVGYVSIADGGLWGWLSHLLIPALALSLTPAAVIARHTRAAVAEVMGQPYVRTAWAKGASVPGVVVHHVLRNAMSAPLTVFGLAVVSMFGSAVIIETLFGIGGVGSLIVQAVRSADVPMLQGLTAFFILLNVGMNLVVDIAYGYLNPKVRISS